MLNNKKELRLYAKEIRKSLNLEEISLSIINKLLSFDKFMIANNILTYYSFGNELKINKLLNIKEKKWYLPKVNGDILDICPYDNSLLLQNKYGIYEPQTQKLNDFSVLDIVIVPCLVADMNGYRIGYGKGYYDRFLSNCRNIFKIVLVPEKLLFDNLPYDSFDIPVDLIITEKSCYKINHI